MAVPPAQLVAGEGNVPVRSANGRHSPLGPLEIEIDAVFEDVGEEGLAEYGRMGAQDRVCVRAINDGADSGAVARGGHEQVVRYVEAVAPVLHVAVSIEEIFNRKVQRQLCHGRAPFEAVDPVRFQVVVGVAVRVGLETGCQRSAESEAVPEGEFQARRDRGRDGIVQDESRPLQAGPVQACKY